MEGCRSGGPFLFLFPFLCPYLGLGPFHAEDHGPCRAEDRGPDHGPGLEPAPALVFPGSATQLSEISTR